MSTKHKASKRPPTRKKNTMAKKSVPHLTLADLFPSLPADQHDTLREKAKPLISKVVATIRRRPLSWRPDTLTFSEQLAAACDLSFPLSLEDAAVLHLVHREVLNRRKQGTLFTDAQPGLRTQS